MTRYFNKLLQLNSTFLLIIIFFLALVFIENSYGFGDENRWHNTYECGAINPDECGAYFQNSHVFVVIIKYANAYEPIMRIVLRQTSFVVTGDTIALVFDKLENNDNNRSHYHYYKSFYEKERNVRTFPISTEVLNKLKSSSKLFILVGLKEDLASGRIARTFEIPLTDALMAINKAIK